MLFPSAPPDLYDHDPFSPFAGRERLSVETLSSFARNLNQSERIVIFNDARAVGAHLHSRQPLNQLQDDDDMASVP